MMMIICLYLVFVARGGDARDALLVLLPSAPSGHILPSCRIDTFELGYPVDVLRPRE